MSRPITFQSLNERTRRIPVVLQESDNPEERISLEIDLRVNALNGEHLEEYLQMISDIQDTVRRLTELSSLKPEDIPESDQPQLLEQVKEMTAVLKRLRARSNSWAAEIMADWGTEVAPGVWGFFEREPEEGESWADVPKVPVTPDVLSRFNNDWRGAINNAIAREMGMGKTTGENTQTSTTSLSPEGAQESLPVTTSITA